MHSHAVHPRIRTSIPVPVVFGFGLMVVLAASGGDLLATILLGLIALIVLIGVHQLHGRARRSDEHASSVYPAKRARP